MSVQTSSAVRFGGFLFDRSAGGLFRLDENGSPVPLPIGSRAVDVLCVLVERQGDLVSKHAIMDAVWPDTAVEENNLTVQISTLRRVLDDGRTDGSYIQTIPGRGYRFVVPVDRHDQAPRPIRQQPTNGDGSDDLRPAAVGCGDFITAPDAPVSGRSLVSARSAVCAKSGRRHRKGLFAILLAALVLVIGTFTLLGRGHDSWLARREAPPPLSLVVLPFENLSGDPKDDYLADGITDDLTSDLSYLSDTFVIARESAYTYKGKPADVRKIGEELGVRYVVEGSVRRLSTTLRVNVQLTSTETGGHLWSERFDEQISELAAGQEAIVTQLRSELGINLVEIEKARSLRERPINPDAFDLVLRARSLAHQPPSLQRNDERKALFEKALELDPSSVAAMVGIAFHLVDRRASIGSWGTLEDMQRAESLLARARAIAPDSPRVLVVTAYLLRMQGRCGETMAITEDVIRRFPNYVEGAYSLLGHCKIEAGHAEEAIPLMQKAIRINPRDPWLFNRYHHMAFASLLLGRDQDAIAFYERSLAVMRDDDGNRSSYTRELAAAYARSGRMAEAKRALAEADRLFPYHTVRMYVPDPSVPVYAEQVRRFQDALRLAGERDHTDEGVDFGVAADGVLHSQLAGLTPTTAPGVATIRTKELAVLLADTRQLVIDASAFGWGRSIPGAVWLESVGLGGSFADAAQGRLRRKMQELTGGDLNHRIVAFGWNSESFRGRNLALRLATLGYANVYWYRGGREAWEVAGLPETELDVQQW